WDAFLEAFEYFKKTDQNEKAFSFGSYMPSAGLRLPHQSQLSERLLSLAANDTDQEAFARMQHAWVVSVADGDIERATPHIERALLLLERSQDVGLSYQILGPLVAINGNYLKWDECAAYALKGIKTADEDGNRVDGPGWFWGCSALRVLGNIKSSRKIATAMVTEGERMHWQQLILLGKLSLISIDMVEGDWRSAQERIKQILDATRAENHPESLKQAEFLIELMSGGDPGRLEELSLLISSIDYFADRDNRRVFPLRTAGACGILGLGGWLMRRADLTGRAAEIATLFLGEMPPHVPINQQSAKVALALHAVVTKDSGQAREMYDSFKSSVGQMAGFDLISGDRLLGLLARELDDNSAAEDHFNAAIEFCRKAGYRPELAWTMSEYAEMLLDRDGTGDPSTRSAGLGQTGSVRDHDRAVELQDEAIAIATELGMKPLLERVLSQREILKA
ncbi:MAG: hypothetical protein J4O07_12020, partial [Chloroflexi bacterium]|nr:hypothetical protein [Chloroflexota bacterium]